MTTCNRCGAKGPLVPEFLEICPQCIKKMSLQEAREVALAIHGKNLKWWNPDPGKNSKQCKMCGNHCELGVRQAGRCGLWRNSGGKLNFIGKAQTAFLHHYLDPNPTNCCNAWFCPAGTGVGYPRFAVHPAAERGTFNLAVFFYGCNFDCLFCQNTSHSEWLRQPAGRPPQQGSIDHMIEGLAENKKITCVCFFGGSPEPQLPFTIQLARRIRAEFPTRILRICWEWNGAGNPYLVDRCAELAVQSGGNLKFDLKAWDERLHWLLCGTTNQQTLDNLSRVGRYFVDCKPSVPALGATTLLVPGYLDVEEVGAISRFIRSISPSIPYSLLVFHPDHYFRDLPVTPTSQARSCLKVAKDNLEHVNLGNAGLLGWER